MEQKKFFKVAFTADRFRSYVSQISDEVRDYTNTDPSLRVYQTPRNGNVGSFSVLKAFSEITLLTAARTLQGARVRESLTKDYARVYHDLDNGFTPLHWMIPGLPLPSYRRRDAAHAKMSQFYRTLISERRMQDTPVSSVSSTRVCSLSNSQIHLLRGTKSTS